MMLCSKLHCQKFSKLKLFSYKIETCPNLEAWISEVPLETARPPNLKVTFQRFALPLEPF